MDVKQLISLLGLNPHPEGGYYRETYRSVEMTDRGEEKRHVSTTIYYLLENDDKSHLHRVASDEIWYFHQGEAVEIRSLTPQGIKKEVLGNDFLKGERPQIIVPANTWFGAGIGGKKGFSLISCSVSPGFEFDDFELADKQLLEKEFGQLDKEMLEWIK